MNDHPLPVFVALLPSSTANANSSPVPAECQNAITRFNNKSGKPHCAAEYAKYLVEVACPERWLLPLMKRATTNGGRTNEGGGVVVKLCYGCGYETTVVVGNANARQAPTGQLAVGITVNRANATVCEIGNACMAGSENVWCVVAGRSTTPNDAQTCLYICTFHQRFTIPALPQEELEKRRRMIRVWPASDDPNVLEKMDEIDICQNHDTSTAVSRLGDDAPLVSAASGSKGTVSKPTHVVQEDTTKNKAKKDPNMPRQGRTTYNFFMEANRGRVIAENPNAKDYKEIQRKLTEEYRSLSNDEMQTYVALSKQDKENQDKAIAEYVSQNGLDGGHEEPRPKRKVKKDASAPKNPKNAYLYFSKEQRPIVKAANPHASFGELGRLIGIAYKSLGEEDMAKYEALAAADKERYLTEMKAYKIKEGGSSGSSSKVKTTGKGPVGDGPDDNGHKTPAAKSSSESSDAKSENQDVVDSDSSPSDEDSESLESSSLSGSVFNSKKRKSTGI